MAILLHFLFVTDYVDKPGRMVALGTSPTSFNVSWEGEKRFWRPDSFSVITCHVRYLSKSSTSLTSKEECQYQEVDGEDAFATFEDLEHFSEYNVTVIGKLYNFEKTVVSNSVARTRECIFRTASKRENLHG